jgi:transketolase
MIATHIDKRFNTSELDVVPSRNGYGDGLRIVGEQDSRVVALCCDLTESTRTHHFAEAFPERFVQIGIAEQNMASVASGMAAMGKVPFIASYAMFSPGRNWEQIRTTIAYNEANVKIIGAHAGVSVGPDGATHQAIEDIAITRVIPKLVVIAPADHIEARKAVQAAVNYDGPVYVRVGREKTPVATTEQSPFTIGKALRAFERDQTHERTVGIVVTGTLLANALYAAKSLNEQGVGASVLHMPTVKPLDGDELHLFTQEHDLLVTVEEHQRIGGLGAAICEFVTEHSPRRVVRIGIDDVFGQSGSPTELLTHYKLDALSITKTILDACE